MLGMRCGKVRLVVKDIRETQYNPVDYNSGAPKADLYHEQSLKPCSWSLALLRTAKTFPHPA